MSTCNNNGEIIKTYIVEDTTVVTACTITVDLIDSCSLTGITLSDSLIPDVDNTINLGTPLRRFRDVNTISGTSTVWTSTGIIYTPILDLGIDSSGDTRQITADNSIIQDDLLNGGNW
jgi:hypothetical protein